MNYINYLRTDLKITVIPGGIRYRDKLNEMTLTTDAKGEVGITWPEPGMYWLTASVGGGRSMGEGANEGPNTAPPARRVGYSATLEVLAQ